MGTSCGPHARPRMHCRQRFSMYFVTRNGFLFTWRTRGKTICGQTILESSIWRHLDPPKIVPRIVFQKNFLAAPGGAVLTPRPPPLRGVQTRPKNPRVFRPQQQFFPIAPAGGNSNLAVSKRAVEIFKGPIWTWNPRVPTY